MANNYSNYVKFVRGNDLAFAALNNNVDQNTLYFITYYERDEADPTKYKYVNDQPIPIKTALYLGNGLVSDSSNNLSQEAQDFLNNLPNSNEVNEGDLQIWVGPKEIEKTDPGTGETILDPETGEPETEIISGHWDTVSIDELVPVFDGSVNGLVPATGAAAGKYLRGDGTWANLTTEILPQVLQSIVGDEPKLDEVTGLPLYKQGDGTEGTEVTNEPIYTNGLSASYDTLVEIAEWLENHSTDALDMQSRITALEQATGVNQTETVIEPKVDEQGRPVYIQLTRDDGEGGSEFLYWDGLTEDDKTTNNTGYPVMIENLDSDDPPYIQDKDGNDNLLFWNITEENLEELETNVDNGNPAFVQETIETQRPIENNDISILNTKMDDLTSLLGYANKPNSEEKVLTVVNNLDSRVTRMETLISEENGEITLIVPEVGNLENLNLRLHPTDEIENEGDPASLVDAINILDTRTRWQELS